MTTPKPLTMWITTNWKIIQEMGIPNHLTCLLRNLYVGQEAIVRTGHGTTDWFQIWEVAHQSFILSPCLFTLYAQYIMRNARLDEAQAGIKIARRSVNKLWYTIYTTLVVKTPILWPPDVKSWLIRKDPDAGKDWGQEEKWMTEDEMVGWNPNSMNMGLGELLELMMDRGPGMLWFMGSQRVRHDWVNGLNWTASKRKEELKSLLIKVKEESEKVGLKLKVQKIRSWHPVPSLHGK